MPAHRILQALGNLQRPGCHTLFTSTGGGRGNPDDIARMRDAMRDIVSLSDPEGKRLRITVLVEGGRSKEPRTMTQVYDADAK